MVPRPVRGCDRVGEYRLAGDWDWGHDVMMVSMGGVNDPVAARDHCIICHDWKIQYHLVYLCVTVSAYTE